jgi:drug/metabolite transporter (DMT)-like permease
LEKNEKDWFMIAFIDIILILIRPDLNQAHIIGNLLVLAGSFAWADLLWALKI